MGSGWVLRDCGWGWCGRLGLVCGSGAWRRAETFVYHASRKVSGVASKHPLEMRLGMCLGIASKSCDLNCA